MSFDKIPQELKERRQWVLWKIIIRQDREIKMPFQPNGTPAKSDDPTTWHEFEECVKAANKYAGLGYVFSEADPYCGIDFDGCLDPDTKKVSEWAEPWIAKLKSYSEISPSGTGIKVWIRGRWPFGNGKNIKLHDQPKINGKTAGVEGYDHKRYFAVTGDRLKNLSDNCEYRQEEVDELYDHFFKEYERQPTRTGNTPSAGSPIVTPLSVIERGRRYLEQVPGAVSGQGGHNQTFKAACALILGFGIGKGEALVLLSEWNKGCEPPWSERELLHKIESADAQTGERGYLLNVKDLDWKTYEHPPYSENVRPILVIDNTKLALSPDEEERLAILEEGSSDGHVFFEASEGLYKLSIREYGIIMEVDRLRRESNELIGELVVKCGMPGVRSVGGILSAGDLNISSVRARMDRARMLGTRTNFGPKEDYIDWIGIIEELCLHVTASERKGGGSVNLESLEISDNSAIIRMPGVVVPARHPTILFGDGGSAKSYLSLYFAGLMVKQGLKVALFDWELAGEDHRERLEMLFPGDMPHITYARCERGITHEVDRLRRIVQDEGIDYAFYDSVAFACGGRPEEAEIAGAYFRAIRQIGVGSWNIAHVSKAEGADQKPFGSSFWHNGARATWFIKGIEDQGNDNVLTVGLYNRKSNLQRIQKTIGFRIEFNDWQTILTLDDVANTPELAAKMTLSQRMRAILKSGPKTASEISEETGVPVKRINETAKRVVKLFVLEGDKIANLYRG